MAKREPGRFRGNLFGGFNRRDVLAYITSVYDELEAYREENEALRERSAELENLLQNLDKSFAPREKRTPHISFKPAPVIPPVAEAPVSEPEAVAELAEWDVSALEPPSFAEVEEMEAPVVADFAPVEPFIEPPVSAPVVEPDLPPVVDTPAPPVAAARQRVTLPNPYPERGLKPTKVKVRRADID